MSEFRCIGEEITGRCGDVYHRNELTTDSLESCEQLAILFLDWHDEIKCWANNIATSQKLAAPPTTHSGAASPRPEQR